VPFVEVLLVWKLMATSLAIGISVLVPEKKESAKMKKMTPVLTVESIEPCLSFWMDDLGFAKTMEVPDGDHLGFAALQKGGVEIMYQTHASVRKEQPSVAKILANSASFLYIEVDSLDAISAGLERHEVIVPRHKTFYGALEIGVREPGGHIIVFAQMAADRQE